MIKLIQTASYILKEISYITVKLEELLVHVRRQNTQNKKFCTPEVYGWVLYN